MSGTIATLKQGPHQTSIVPADSWHNGFVTCGPNDNRYNVLAGGPPDKIDNDATLIITTMKDGSWTLDAGWYAPMSANNLTRERTTRALEQVRDPTAHWRELTYHNAERSAITAGYYFHNMKEITHTAKYDQNIFVSGHNRLFSVGTIVGAHSQSIPAFPEPEQTVSLTPSMAAQSSVASGVELSIGDTTGSLVQ